MDVKIIENTLDKRRYDNKNADSEYCITEACKSYPKLLKSILLIDTHKINSDLDINRDEILSLLKEWFNLFDFLLNITQTNKHNVDILRIFLNFFTEMHSLNKKINLFDFLDYASKVNFDDYKNHN